MIEPSIRYLHAKQQTELGELPNDWSCLELGDVSDILTGFPFPSAGYSESGTRLLRGANVKRDRIEWQEELTAYWPNVTADIRKYLLRSGDVVVAMDGSLVGRSFGALSEQDVPALLLQRVARIRSSQVEIGYLKHWICSEKFTEHSDAVKTTTAIPHISPGDIRSFKIAVPPTSDEQRKIGQALSDADALIDSLEQLLIKKRQIKQGAMQELLAGKRRLPGFTAQWVVRRIGSFAPLQRGFDLPSRARRPGPHPVVYSNGILNFHNEYQVKGPGVVTGRSGTIGAVTFVEQDYWPHNTSLWVTNFKSSDPKFVFYLFQQIGLERFATGSGVPTLNRNDVHSFEVLVPASVDEQATIAKVLADMDTDITAIEFRITKARTVKKAMVQALLTGRIRLVEPQCMT